MSVKRSKKSTPEGRVDTDGRRSLREDGSTANPAGGEYELNSLVNGVSRVEKRGTRNA